MKTSITKAMVLSTALLLSVQTSVNAGEALSSLTSIKAQQFSRDLIQPNSQDFFRQGRVMVEREIQILQQRRLSSTNPPLNIIDEVQPLEKEPSLRRDEAQQHTTNTPFYTKIQKSNHL